MSHPTVIKEGTLGARDRETKRGVLVSHREQHQEQEKALIASKRGQGFYRKIETKKLNLFGCAKQALMVLGGEVEFGLAFHMLRFTHHLLVYL